MKKTIFYEIKKGFVKGACFLILSSLFGCSQPLQTLIELGAEQKAQQAQVVYQEKKFSLLLRDAKAGHIKGDKTTCSEVRVRYGEPVLEQKAQAPGEKTIWMYRKPVAFIDSSKVYLEFDNRERVSSVRIEESRGQ
jgi:hypothetical protein